VAHRQPPEGDRRRRPARSGAGGPDLAPRGTPVLCETADEGMLAQAERYRTNEYDSLGYWAERDMDPDVLRPALAHREVLAAPARDAAQFVPVGG
jgi:hypothetical protein